MKITKKIGILEIPEGKEVPFLENLINATQEELETFGKQHKVVLKTSDILTGISKTIGKGIDQIRFLKTSKEKINNSIAAPLGMLKIIIPLALTAFIGITGSASALVTNNLNLLWMSVLALPAVSAIVSYKIINKASTVTTIKNNYSEKITQMQKLLEQYEKENINTKQPIDALNEIDKMNTMLWVKAYFVESMFNVFRNDIMSCYDWKIISEKKDIIIKDEFAKFLLKHQIFDPERKQMLLERIVDFVNSKPEPFKAYSLNSKISSR